MSEPATILEAIYARRSIRRFRDQPVEREKLTELLKAAMAAPSAMNSRPWEFVVVTEPATLAQLRNTLPFGRYHAPAAIAVCGNTRSLVNPTPRLFWQQDCSAATENILLAAVGLGLGTVWIGIHPVPQHVLAVRQALRLPRGITPLNVLYVGYPAEEKPSRTRYEEDKVHWQTY